MSTTRVVDKNIGDIFAILIILLKLQPASKKRLFFKDTPFSFEVLRAVEIFKHLELTIELGAVTTTVTYGAGPQLARGLLNKFYEAHLLHDPHSRTEISLGMSAQVTPKGTALVYNFCLKTGMPRDDMPAVVKSAFNSMTLFSFERLLLTNRVFYLRYLLHVLLSKLMGPAPNLWSPKLKPPLVQNKFEEASLDFVFADLSLTPDSFDLPETLRHLTESPFHHKYFTNPESDAFIQYYESESGVRVSQTGAKITVTGKSIVQWLMDCSAVLSQSEAMELGQLMLRLGLVVGLDDVTGGFSNDRSARYELTETGKAACQWDKGSGAQISSDFGEVDVTRPDLDDSICLLKILQDPGMRYLFRTFVEKQQCAENVDAYVQLLKFFQLRKQLQKLLRMHSRTEEPEKRARLSRVIESHSNTTYSMAFHLYSVYLCFESQCDVNIDFALQKEVYEVMMGIENKDSPYPKTPVMELCTYHTPNMADDEHDITSVFSVRAEAEQRSLHDTIRAIDRMHAVFGKVNKSIQRMMEADQYPKFIESADYQYAVKLEAKRKKGHDLEQ